MTTKEKVIAESIKRIEREICKINDILDARPLLEIIRLQQEALTLVRGSKFGDKNVLKELDRMAAEEKKHRVIAKKQRNSVKLIERKVKLEMELSDLHSEQFFMNMRKKKSL